MSQRVLMTLLVCVAWLTGCGGATQQADEPGVVTETRIHEDHLRETAPAPAAPVAEQTTGAIDRAALRALLDRGPAYVLGRVELTPVYESRRFAGFRIDRFKAQPPEYFELRPGDVIRRVNGRTVDTPESYFEIFEELKVASELRFEVVRDGRELQFSYPIVNGPS